MRIVFNCMNYRNPNSGGMNVMMDQMRFLKEENFDVAIYFYSFDESAEIQKIIGNEFKILKIDELDPKNDLVIVAEEFVWVARDILIPRGIRYIVFNQGVSASLWSYNTYNEHIEIYNKAKAVLVNSLHTKKSVEELFNVPKEKIFIYRLSIDKNMYYPEPKEKMACCLEYKNGTFVRFITHYFEDKFPDWKLKVINMRPKDETAAVFRKSKLFLSFGGPEGFGLPPLEAAFSGCRVIGFHGEGGAEYFKPPVFTSVNFMDHLDFIKKLKICMNDIDQPYQQNYFDYVDYLKYFYSESNAKKSVVSFFSHVKNNLFEQI